MSQCKAQVAKKLNFLRYRPCKNAAIDGSDFCHAHDPNKAPKPRDEAKENIKRALYLAQIRHKYNRGNK